MIYTALVINDYEAYPFNFFKKFIYAINENLI